MLELGKVRVFLVDDHPLVREGLKRLLELDETIQVVGEAENAEDAIVRPELASTQVVLMDIELPGIDGIEATRQLMARDRELKVVILSGFGDEYLTPAIEAGARGYILKTASQQELVQAVVKAASGQSPITASLGTELFSRFADLSKMTRPSIISGRQQEILRMVVSGLASKEIIQRLSISESTLTREFRNIFDCLGVNSRSQAVAEAYKRKLI